jgi:thermitase
VPWLPWKHCFKFYDFRTAVVPVDKAAVAEVHLERVVIRVRYEHALCLLGRKQGPIIHSLTLLPKEQLRIYESDRYRRATSATSRFSVRTSFFTMTQRVNDAFSSTKTSAGGGTSVSSSVSGSAGGGIDIPIINLNFGAETSASAATTTSTYFDVARVSEQFSHVAETSSLAVESERSIVVSTFEDQENLQTTARTLRNDNECRAVTYFIRRVFEIYALTTRIVAIEVQIAGQWVDVRSTPEALQKAVRTFLAKLDVGASHDPKVEIALPTDGLLYEAELAHCCSCECEHEAKARLELERLQLENLNLRLEAERRQKRLQAGELDAFEPVALPSEQD